MKKHIIFSLLAVVMMACSNDDTEGLIVSKDLISIPYSLQLQEDGQGMELVIKANCYWTISSSAEWLSFTPSEGIGNGYIYVTAERNLNMVERSGELTIYAGRAPVQVVRVTQSKATEEENKQVEPGIDDNRPPT